ncbi:hypothetical protein RhiirA4_519154 [Rhizophagus irregularis]|uniref:Protein kinase domain-containing protein n=1 Tax=Rhizophagus irregularis TaxID=588596 RepID=A0A2I1GHW3_9GLOM|nr:hypothetical protein RhiirA4_519154 [Rhizophagus irregularis]
MKVALKVLIDKKTLIIKEDDIKKIVNKFSSKYQRFPWNNKSKMILEIIEYANEGNLRDYLNEKFDSLQWENKIQMAFDITSGLKCLHSKNIIHRHLGIKNVGTDIDHVYDEISRQLNELDDNNDDFKY